MFMGKIGHAYVLQIDKVFVKLLLSAFKIGFLYCVLVPSPTLVAGIGVANAHGPCHQPTVGLHHTVLQL